MQREIGAARAQNVISDEPLISIALRVMMHCNRRTPVNPVDVQRLREAAGEARNHETEELASTIIERELGRRRGEGAAAG